MVAEQLAEQLHIWLVFIRGYKYGLNDQICGYYPKCSSVVGVVACFSIRQTFLDKLLCSNYFGGYYTTTLLHFG